MNLLLRLSIVPTFIIVFSAGCGSPVNSKEYDFSRPAVIRTELTTLQLARSQDIPHRILRRTVATGKYFFDSDFYDVEFPTLNENEFRRLQNIYGVSRKINPSLRSIPPHSGPVSLFSIWL